MLRLLTIAIAPAGLQASLAVAVQATGACPPQAANWGDVPTWVAAIAAIGALIAAIVAGVYAKRANDRESDRDLLLAEDRRQEQAAKIGVWPHANSTEGVVPRTVYGVQVANLSSLPVTNVLVNPTFKRGDTTFAPTGWPPVTIASMPPGQRFVPLGMQLPEGRTFDELWLSVAFTDSSGSRWFRTPIGRLMRQPHDDAPQGEWG